MLWMLRSRSSSLMGVYGIFFAVDEVLMDHDADSTSSGCLERRPSSM